MYQKKGKCGKKQGNFYIKVRFDGIQKEVCLGTANKRQADKNRAKVIVELAKGKFYGFS